MPRLPKRHLNALRRLRLLADATWQHVMAIHVKIGMREQADDNHRAAEERCADEELEALTAS